MLRLSSRLVPAVLLSTALASGADCTFTPNRDEFLGRAARNRQSIVDRTRRLLRGQKLSAPVSPDSLPQRNFIDQEILGKLTKAGSSAAPLSSDEEFLRRIYLDLTGRLPSPDDVRAFLADPSGAKRDTVIDALLSSPEFTDRWTMWLGDLLGNTSKLANAAVQRNAQGRNAFYAYIKDAVANDKSFREIATDVITATGNNYSAGTGSANFPLGASTSMGPIQDTFDTMLVRTATAFLGMGNYDCLLCHNGRGHLDQVNLWGARQTRTQAESMAAFFSRMNFNQSSGGSFDVVESSGGGYDLHTESGNRPPRISLGPAGLLFPVWRDGGDPMSDGDWRAAFAANITKDPMFARNLANRLWKQMFGLALADPVDGLDPARLDPTQTPPEPWTFQASHPALLEQLASELTKGDFHLRPFLRLLVQSSAYQLSSRVSGDFSEGAVPLFARHYARRMEGEEVHDAIAKATGVLGSYSVTGWPDRVNWAMQLPEPTEPASDNNTANFMNNFLRGNRDTLDRSQAGSIQQELALMNDSFVINRVKLKSPKLSAIAQMPPDQAVEELFLTFLSRMPTAAERAVVQSASIEDIAWACINRVEFLYSY